MSNIPVIAEINNLLDADTTAIAKTALGVLGAATKGDIVAADLATNAVTTAKITDANVTAAKLAANAAQDNITLLPVAKGGTGTATPAIVAGTNVTVSGTWPNQTVNATGGGGTPAADSITTAMLQSGSVTAAKVTDGALTIAKTSGLQAALDAKQVTLVSGTNIKSVNNTPLLGAGNVTITGSDVIDVTASPYNAVADGKLGENGVMASGGYTLTGSGFATSGLAGKFIRVVGAGAGGADLVTTIVSSTSTVLTLTAPAVTTVAAAQFFYGTDNTAAINSAILAANNSTTTKTVLIPAGIFLGNYLGYPHVHIKGVGGIHGQSAYTSGNLPPARTVLLPAVSTLAVIRYRAPNQGCGGVHIENILIVGGNGTNTVNRLGNGIEFGNPSNTNAQAEGSGFKLSACEINGFYRGVTMSSIWDVVIERCQFNYCKIGVFGGEYDLATNVASDTGPSDGVSIISCGSNFADVVFDFRGSKSVAIICGDYNSFLKFVMSSGSKIFVSGINLEAGEIADVLFHLYDNSAPSTLDVGNVLLINTRTTAPATDSIWSEHSTGGNISWKFGGAVNLKTKSLTAYPQLLPAGSSVQRMSTSVPISAGDNPYATELWDVISLPIQTRRGSVPLTDNFFGSYAASPYGQLGWVKTNIGSANDYGVTFEANSGALRFASTSNVSTNNFARLDTGYATVWGQLNFEMSFTLNNESWSTAVSRVGLYNLGALLKPLYGIGIRLDRSEATPDTEFMFETRNNGVNVATSTGVAYTVAGVKVFNIVRKSNVFHVTVKTNTGTILGYCTTSATNLVPQSMAPAIYNGVSTPGYGTILIKDFSLTYLV